MEKNGNGKPQNITGVYRHRDAGNEIYLEVNPDTGTALIDAFVQQGYEWIKATEDKVEPESIDSIDDTYTKTITKSGVTQHRHNGKLISKEQYDNNK